MNLQQTVAGWMTLGFSKAEALRHIVAHHFRLRQARGAGRITIRDARRRATIGTRP